MCNLIRYKEEMQEVYGAFEEFSHVRITPKVRFKVAPSEPAPVITTNHGRPGIDMMQFGLKTRTGRQLMARGETVAQLPMFRRAFRSQRCLIICHGFFDSQDMGKYRQPWHFHLKGDGVMCFAGLWEARPDGDSFAIVSAPANSLVARVIDRMPVILPRSSWRQWLDSTTSGESLQAMLKSLPSEMMESWPVTREVNKRGCESPECLVPVVVEQGELNLEYCAYLE